MCSGRLTTLRGWTRCDKIRASKASPTLLSSRYDAADNVPKGCFAYLVLLHTTNLDF